MFEKLRTLIADQFGIDVEAITADTVIVDDLGADSVDLVDLAMALEDEFGLDELSEENLTTIITVGDLYKYMQEHLEA